MPTPFTHLIATQSLLSDPHIPQDVQDKLHAQQAAFVLGNIAIDAQSTSGGQRADTHFYEYTTPITTPPWRIMLERYPELMCPKDAAHQIFIAGCVVHLAMDEFWTKYMLIQQFAEGEWATFPHRFYMLNIMLVYVDRRDYASIAPWQAECLKSAQADRWLDFITDAELRHWQTLIYDQIKVGGESQTLRILSNRIGTPINELMAFVISEEKMQTELWQYISQSTLASIEAQMYDYARQQLLLYMDESEIE